jgi:EpsD family peptidyl-prolyl cis-trans isomerase
MNCTRFKAKNCVIGKLVLIAVASIVLVACDQVKQMVISDSDQAAVRVDGKEISVHQVSLVLDVQQARSGVVDPDVAVEKLIERQLAVNNAIENRLDRDPAIMLRLEEIRLDMLANSYLGRIAANMDDPVDAEILEFYEKNPALFSQRKFYGLREFGVDLNHPLFEDIQTMLFENKTLLEIADWLRQQESAFRMSTVVRTAEQLPMESVAKLNRALTGDVVIFQSPRKLHVYELMLTTDAPLTVHQARETIVGHLTSQKLKKEMKWKMKAMRAKAKIEYLNVPTKEIAQS